MRAGPGTTAGSGARVGYHATLCSKNGEKKAEVAPHLGPSLPTDKPQRCAAHRVRSGRLQSSRPLPVGIRWRPALLRAAHGAGIGCPTDIRTNSGRCAIRSTCATGRCHTTYVATYVENRSRTKIRFGAVCVAPAPSCRASRTRAPAAAGPVLAGARSRARVLLALLGDRLPELSARHRRERLRLRLLVDDVQRLLVHVGLGVHHAVRALRRSRLQVPAHARQLLRQAAPRRRHLPSVPRGRRHASATAASIRRAAGPTCSALSEWEYLPQFGDRERLSAVFPALRRLRRSGTGNYRTWPNGSYWGTGLASGMDNQPRTPTGAHTQIRSRAPHLGRHQPAGGARPTASCSRMADVLGRRDEVHDFERGERAARTRGSTSTSGTRRRASITICGATRRALDRREDDRRVLGAARGRGAGGALDALRGSPRRQRA